MTGSPDLYAVLFDVAPEAVEDWLRWYIGRHLPDLLTSGFLSARAFQSAQGSPRFVTLYEQSEDVLGSRAYLAARERDDSLERNESQVRNLQKGTYRQLLLTEAVATDARWMGLLGFDLPQERDSELLDRLKREAGHVLGVAACGLAIRLGGHPLFPESVAPRLLLIVEAVERPEWLHTLADRLERRFGGVSGWHGPVFAERYFFQSRHPDVRSGSRRPSSRSQSGR